MKKFNSLLARFMLVLLALHGLMGAFTLLRMTTFNWKPLSYTLLAIVLLHGDTLFSRRTKSKRPLWTRERNIRVL